MLLDRNLWSGEPGVCMQVCVRQAVDKMLSRLTALCVCYGEPMWSGLDVSVFRTISLRSDINIQALRRFATTGTYKR